MSICYSGTFYDGKTLNRAAKVYLEYLPHDVNGLLSQGTSGCAIASAMLVKSRRKLSHVAIRKDGEMSHQAGYAGTIRGGKYVIVDDFMETGKTINRIYEWAKARGIEVAAIFVGHRKGSFAFECPVVELDKHIKGY